MRTPEFEQNYNKLKARIDDLMIYKAKEYAESDGDRLFNFTQVTSLFKTHPAMVCMFYQSKHYASLVKICQDLEKGIFPSRELVEEKAGDLISYTYLLYACLIEMIEAHEQNGSVTHVEATQTHDSSSDDKVIISEIDCR